MGEGEDVEREKVERGNVEREMEKVACIIIKSPEEAAVTPV